LTVRELPKTLVKICRENIKELPTKMTVISVIRNLSVVCEMAAKKSTTDRASNRKNNSQGL